MNVYTRVTSAIVLGAVGLLASQSASAGAVLTYGQTTIGVNDSGELNFTTTTDAGDSITYGVSRAGVGDAISPGCFCEGWGVSLISNEQSFATWANQDSGSGGFGLVNSFGSVGNTATSFVSMDGVAVTVRQAYGPSLAADVFQNQVTITNNTGATIDNLVYRRSMDWDVPPTQFNEYVTHWGVQANLTSNGGNVLYASDDGFVSSNPLTAASPIDGNTVNTDFYRSGPSDHGSVFDFSFGSLAAGESRIFNIYYGSAANEAEAVSKLTSLGANVYSLGQRSEYLPVEGGGGDVPAASMMAVSSSDAPVDPGAEPTFLFGFGGVAGVEVGSSQDVPVLPFNPAPGQFFFDAPVSGRWFDPPFAEGFDISLTDATFTSVTAPEGFEDLILLAADGTILDDDFDAGETFYFASGVSVFKIRGTHLDTASDTFSTALPLRLDFTPGATSMTWTAALAPVPEPSSYALMLTGLAALSLTVRRRNRQN
ncbi:MAG TPA: PEP-CTERM sorting domain-containing protein [Aquabacterium sp.]|uniref:PEP-CTERM sorting domain-containing protein n=1 Tax=Aquabacterium sp. TaxID=1872578 RepID=UPI002E2ECF90|nr:PEP-CTERM sorting domain-containing protein [Aquabacterium sp.]HEX5371787.1 PEP-CTERM sorting domain-containing protein [Aquabacterium sp.]